MPERWALGLLPVGGIEYRLEIAVAAEAADGFVCVVGVVWGQQDKRVWRKAADGTEQPALVSRPDAVDHGNSWYGGCGQGLSQSADVGLRS